MSTIITNALLDYLATNEYATNEQAAEHVRRTVPGCSTTAASVSSMKSRMRRDGVRAFDRAPSHESAFAFDRASASPDDHVRVASRPTQQFGVAALPEFDPSETIDESKHRIAVRYDAMERMSERAVHGRVPSLVISGPPGLGKSWTVNNALRRRFPEGQMAVDAEGAETGVRNYDRVSGSISAVGLYQALYHCRETGSVLVLDDVDDVFRDETALNLLKGALDSSRVRTIGWRKEARWLEENGIPDRFDFAGSVVFLTNIDFETLIASGRRDAEHFKALIDRSMYLCLTLRTRRDFMIRIRQVSEGERGMLATEYGLDAVACEEVLEFIAEHQSRFYNLSLRLVGQVAMCRAADPTSWRGDVEATKMRTL